MQQALLALSSSGVLADWLVKRIVLCGLSGLYGELKGIITLLQSLAGY